MNWGHKISIVIIVFIISMFGMVYVAYKQTNEMIDEKYYEKELAYQSIIDAKANLETYTKNSLIVQNDSLLILTIPNPIFKNIKDGSIEFLRIESKSKDVILKLETNDSGIQLIDKKGFYKGWYKMRIRWKSNDQFFFEDENIKVL